MGTARGETGPAQARQSPRPEGGVGGTLLGRRRPRSSRGVWRAGGRPNGWRGGVASAQPLGPATGSWTPPHLHVGHEALLDSPGVLIDLFQELQLIVVVATHGGDRGSNSRTPSDEQLPRAVRLAEAPPSGTKCAGAGGCAAGWATASAEAPNVSHQPLGSQLS